MILKAIGRNSLEGINSLTKWITSTFRPWSPNPRKFSEAFPNVTVPATVFVIFSFILLFIIIVLLAICQAKKRRESHKRLNQKPAIVFDQNDADIIIVGAGVLGSAMATVLARDGRKVTLVERDLKEPDRIIGELLQPGGCEVIRKLGLRECLENIEEPQITQGYVIHDLKTRTAVHIPYPMDSGPGNRRKEGYAFRHGKFIMSLRKTAQAEKNVTILEGTVSSLIEDNEVVVGITYKPKYTEGDIKKLHAPLVIVADGGFSKFRKQLHDDQAQVYSHFVGCIMKNCPQIQDKHAELVLADPYPVLVYKISDEETRVLVDIRGRSPPKNLREYLIDNVLPALPEHLSGPFEDGVINEKIRYMPCKFLPPSNVRKNGVLMLGDAFNMRHPLTGGGMSVALSDIYIWKCLLSEIPNLTDYAATNSAYTVFQNSRKINHSFAVNILAQALYELFSAQDEHLARLRDACFEYFKLGGECVNGPVGLLSVVSPKPLTLIGHFFAVALYSVWITMKASGLNVPLGLYRSLGTFYKACKVIFPLIWTEVRTIA